MNKKIVSKVCIEGCLYFCLKVQRFQLSKLINLFDLGGNKTVIEYSVHCTECTVYRGKKCLKSMASGVSKLLSQSS